MIIGGDFVFPFTETEDFNIDVSEKFAEENKILNFEGQIIDVADKRRFNKGSAGIFSTKRGIDILSSLNVVCVGLANNHITDFPFAINRTTNFLKDSGILSIGAGNNVMEALKPYYFVENGKKHAILNFGWSVIGCRYADKNKEGVAPFRLNEIENAIKNLVKDHNEKISILLYMHHGFEFDKYPQPGHRKLFHHLINKYSCIRGIFSHHSHIIQVFEIHRNVPIFYGLGNFILPVMKYPNLDITALRSNKDFFKGICIKYHEEPNEMEIFHLTFSNRGIKEVCREKLRTQTLLEDISLKDGEKVAEYYKLYKSKSKKKVLMPVYKDFDNKAEILFKGFIIKCRHGIIKLLNFINIIKPYKSKG